MLTLTSKSFLQICQNIESERLELLKITLTLKTHLNNFSYLVYKDPTFNICGNANLHQTEAKMALKSWMIYAMIWLKKCKLLSPAVYGFRGLLKCKNISILCFIFFKYFIIDSVQCIWFQAQGHSDWQTEWLADWMTDWLTD